MEAYIKTLNLEKAKNGEMTGKINLIAGDQFYLHSRYNPTQEARAWLAQVALSPFTAYIVMGFGLGYHVRELLMNLPEQSRIYVVDYSQNENLTQFAYHHMPDTDWMLDERIKVFSGPDLRVLAGEIFTDLRRHMLRRVTVCKHFPTMQIFKDFYDNVIQTLVPKIAGMFEIDNTHADEAKLERIENLWANLPSIWRNRGIVGFNNTFNHVPAIIVSAGPSLNKNIQVLKEYQNQAVIIAVGTAMGALRKHGITPHFQIIGDKYELAYKALKEHFDAGTALISYYEVYPKIVESYVGNKFFCLFESSQYPKDLLDILPPTGPLKANVSVAMSAFDFARICGCNPIIFVGQDCAYAKGSTHADGVVVLRDTDKIKNSTLTVRGHNGEDLPTELGFKELLDALIMEIRHTKDRTVINATEGGAFIDGAIHLPLKAVGEKYLGKVCDIPAIIRREADWRHESSSAVFAAFSANLTEQLKSMIRAVEDSMKETLNCCATDVSENTVAVKVDFILAGSEAFERKMAQLISEVIDLPVYDYIKLYFQPLYEQFVYQMQSGLKDEERYIGYAILRGHLLLIGKRVLDLVGQATAEICGEAGNTQ